MTAQQLKTAAAVLASSGALTAVGGAIAESWPVTLTGAATAAAGGWLGSMVLIWRWIQDALTAAITQFEVAEQDQVALALAREGIETERANLGRLREDIEPLSEKRLARALRAFDQMLAAEVRKREAAEAQHAALTAEYEEMAKDFNHLVEHELRSSNRRFGMEPPADPKKGRIIRPQKWRRGPAATTGPTTYGTMSADQSQLS